MSGKVEVYVGMLGTPLPLVEKNCLMAIEEALPFVIKRSLTMGKMQIFCTMYRRMAISKLFMSGLPEPFFENLSKSARAFLYFLEGASEDVKATSKSDPFFDAVACNDAEAMQKIARLSRASWNEAEEYEDDFLYVYFLMARFALDTPSDRLESLLKRYEVVLEGNADPRLDVCRSFLETDQDLFHEAIGEIIQTRQEDISEKMDYEKIPLDDVHTTAKLWVELLALLRFAEMAGLATDNHCPMAPDIARGVGRARVSQPDAWQMP